MSKYDALWRSIQDSGTKELTLTFDQIEDLAGVPLDHSFLRYKKELIEYGSEVDGISRKARTVTFRRLALRTDRLTLFPCSRAEMERILGAETDGELKTAYGEMLRGALREPKDWVWNAVWRIEAADGVPVGDLSFKGIAADGTVEIGYGIREEYRGRGFAAEAVSAVVRWASRQPRVKRIEAETAPDNAASQRVLAKCGFVPTGTAGEEGPRFVWTGFWNKPANG